MKSVAFSGAVVVSLFSSSVFAQWQFNNDARPVSGQGGQFLSSVTPCGTCDLTADSVNTNTLELSRQRTLRINRLANSAIQYAFADTDSDEVLTTTVCPLGTVMTTATRNGTVIPGFDNSVFAAPSAVTNVNMQCMSQTARPVMTKRNTIQSTTSSQAWPLGSRDWGHGWQNNGWPINGGQGNGWLPTTNNGFSAPDAPTPAPFMPQDASMCPTLTCRPTGVEAPAVWVARTTPGHGNLIQVEATVYQDQLFEMKFFNPVHNIVSKHMVCPDGSSRVTIGSNTTDLTSVRLKAGPFESDARYRWQQLNQGHNGILFDQRNNVLRRGVDECVFVIRNPHGAAAQLQLGAFAGLLSLVAALTLL